MSLFLDKIVVRLRCVYTQLMTTETQGVLPHCACQRCRTTEARQRVDASPDIHKPSSAQRLAAPFESPPTQCHYDHGDDSQRPPPMDPLRSDDSSSLCCKKEDYVRAASDGPLKRLPAAAHLPEFCQAWNGDKFY